jgi:magnesium-protoporphyrin IX monomethyl ester (oxidative) cyclase
VLLGFNLEMMLADHARPVRYELPLPPQQASDAEIPKAAQLYIHAHRGRAGRNIDASTERSVDAARMGFPG